MSKITKKLFDDYKTTKKVVKKTKFAHQQNVDKIKEIILPYVDENYKKHTNHEITGIDFCNDNDYKIKDLPVEYDWIKISEREYDNLNDNNKRWNFKTELKVEQIYEPDYDEFYYKKDKKHREYLRVYVHEWWSYGGTDNLSYDYLLSDIMDEQYLRKEKLKKLEELS